jgi:hypothetical protein
MCQCEGQQQSKFAFLYYSYGAYRSSVYIFTLLFQTVIKKQKKYIQTTILHPMRRGLQLGHHWENLALVGCDYSIRREGYMVMVGKLHLIGGLSSLFLFSLYFFFTLFSSVRSGFLFGDRFVDDGWMYFCWFHYYLCVIGLVFSFFVCWIVVLFFVCFEVGWLVWSTIGCTLLDIATVVYLTRAWEIGE